MLKGQPRKFLVIALLVTVAVALAAIYVYHSPTSPLSHASPTPARSPATPGLYEAERGKMVERQIKARGVEDPAVLQAMENVPRHAFVPSEQVKEAYADHPLPIGFGQTISQPYIVAYMTEIVQLEEGEKVLEIGTGSGYQAAVLAEITPHVYSVEIIEGLYDRARRTLSEQGYDQAQLKHGDGYYGWEEHAPYDAIVVTAAPDHIPQPLTGQLADGGRMVIPVGPPGAYQALWLVEREGEEIKTERLMGVRFVPLTGEH
ncbi:MAG: protein-L-isoaspartate(D-aspartate) O-methyltransferase [Anaerolineae bacterium]